jgi:glycosyltransferase involved in cell wall biosynthesis
MNIKPYKAKLEGKTFMFFIGHYLNLGGAEAAAIILAKELQQRYKAKIIFVAGSPDGKVKNDLDQLGFKTLYFKFNYKAKPYKKIPSYLKLIYLIRKHKPDFLLPYVAGNNKMVLPIWKYTGAKYAWWMQQDEGRELYKTKFEKWTIDQASDIISNSEVGMDFIQEAYDKDKSQMVHYNNVIYVPNQYDLKSFWRSKLDIKKNTLIVSMIANITPFKDHETLFKAWPLVVNHFKQQNQPICLLLAGQPKKETITMLKILGFDLRISDSLYFLGGTDKTNELISASDLVVHSSIKEGCPNAVCEAMALGKAVVGTDIPGNSEALTRTYENFCLSQPKNSDDLAQKIIHVLEHPELRNEIGNFNKKRIIEHYNVEQMLDKITASFEI